MNASERLLAQTTSSLTRDLDSDLVGIWQIFWFLRRGQEDWTEEDIDAAAEEVLRRLVDYGAIFGELHRKTGDYVAWDDQDGGIARASAAWRAMDRDPTIGEIAWLDLAADR